MRNAFVDELLKIAAEDPRVIAVLADNGLLVFDEFQKKFPEQFLNLGIAEGNLVTVSAGMASVGLVPFAYTILPFLTKRAFEFIRDDVCYQRQNVKLIGIGAGFAYSTLGPTHHGTEDIAMTRGLPGLTVISPADPMETAKATAACYAISGPVYLRIGKGKDPVVYREDYKFEVGKGVCLREGTDITLVGTGGILAEALEAAEKLSAEKGILARVINIHTLSPIDDKLLIESAKATGAVLTVEDHSIYGGLGGAVAEILAENTMTGLKFARMGLRGTFCLGYGSVSDLRRAYGLDASAIYSKALEMLGGKQ